MATEKQIGFAKKLLSEKGYNVEEYIFNTAIPHTNISNLIDQLLHGNTVPTPAEWNQLSEGSVAEPMAQAPATTQPVGNTDYDKSIFAPELSSIHSPAVKYIMEKMLDAAPKYFWQIPASSTGKYHPEYSLGKGGLVRHEKGAIKIGRELLGHPSLFNFSQFEKDCAIAALSIHDITKSGMTDELKGEYTAHEHPLLVRKLAESIGLDKECHSPEAMDGLAEAYDTIMSAVASHMGPWTSNSRSAIVLPEPQTELERFVHLCDYLGSRKFLEVKF